MRACAAALGGLAVLLVAACSGTTADGAPGEDAPGSTAEQATTSRPAGEDAGRADVGTSRFDASAPAECSGTDALCVEAVPIGWRRVALYEGVDEAPPCELPLGGEVFTAQAGLARDAAECSSCALQDPNPKSVAPCSASVDTVPWEQYGYGCFGEPRSSMVPACTFASTSYSTRLSLRPKPATGVCEAPAKQSARVPKPRWATTLRACDAPRRAGAWTCSGDDVCATVPPKPFLERVCVFRRGDLACPSTWYADKHTGFNGVTDTRSCSACTVAFSGDCSGVSLRVHSQAGCSDQGQALSGGMSCMAASGYLKLADTTPKNTACTAAGGVPTGEIEPSDPVTVCCHDEAR